MDAELVVRAQNGDRAAFTELATVFYGRLHRVAQNILNDIHLAEDATQQAVLEMWRNLPKLRDPERFEAWSYRILVNACRAEGRKSKRWMPALGLPSEEDPAAVAGFAGVVYRDQLERGFRRLAIEQREVVVLHHYLSWPLPEVAAALGIPTGTAHSRLHRAMQTLRAALEADARLPQSAASSEEAAR
ncbi:MAG: RNA polymerase sigma factor [Chloroflexota bacterium]